MATAPLPISPYLLADLLHLPHGTEIQSVYMDYDTFPRAVVMLVVSHADIPAAASRVEPTFRSSPTGRVEFLSWNPITA